MKLSVVRSAAPPRTPGRRLRSFRSSVSMGVAMAMIAGAAQAKTLGEMGAAASKTDATKPLPAAPDGLAGGGFYLEAETLVQNDTNKHVQAAGSVEARYKGRVLRADHVDYDTQSGVVIATGHVKVIQADGTAQFADTMSLDKTMSEGFATGFSTRLEGHVKIAARGATRKNAQITQFDHVIYTPCLVCVENGQTQPTWSIKARTITEDKAHQSLTFSGATIDILGHSVFYFPILKSADPSANHRSGFLLPIITFSGPRGVSYEQPYYQSISPSQDLLITPQVNSQVNPFLNIDYRQRFYSGSLEFRGGYTYSKDFTSSGSLFGRETSRSYILANGEFRVNDRWVWGFSADRASDKLIFDKYSVQNAFTDNGLYAADARRLLSQIYAVEQSPLTYLSLAAISVQGLRANDDQSSIPTVAPLIEGRWEAANPILGGRLRVNGSAVMLTRNQALSPTGASIEGALPGYDSRRASLKGDWQRSLTFDNGLRLQPFLNARADVFNVTNPGLTPSNSTITRGFGTIGANVAYPLTQRVKDVTYILEPLGQLAISPNVKQDARIPNEDSTVFDFDETNLFNPNRSPGSDLYEGGQSLTLAGRATAIFDDGRSASLLIGRRLAARTDPSVPGRTGLATAASDWVVAADAVPVGGVRLYSRLRLDARSFAFNRVEAGASFATSRVEGYVSYLREALSPTGAMVDSLDVHGALYATRHWGVTGYIIVDGEAWRRRDLGIVYRDDCLRVEVLYRHDETFNGTLGPSSSVVLRLTLATLGNTR